MRDSPDAVLIVKGNGDLCVLGNGGECIDTQVDHPISNHMTDLHKQNRQKLTPQERWEFLHGTLKLPSQLSLEKSLLCCPSPSITLSYPGPLLCPDQRKPTSLPFSSSLRPSRERPCAPLPLPSLSLHLQPTGSQMGKICTTL